MRNTNFIPLKDELLKRYNFFELYPFDGGGFFIQSEIVGSLDDRRITANILNGALDDFGPLDEIDFTRFEFWKTIEKSCWINRMYFIVSMARCAMLDNNFELAQRIEGIIRRFNRTYQPPADRQAVQALDAEIILKRDRDYNSGNAMGAIPYQWFDFQPASRVINVLNAMNFLKGFDLPQEEFEAFIATHARVIYDSDDEHNLAPGNHQALRGLSLLYAGNYLENSEYIRAGSAVCNYHMVNDYLSDGMLIDMSPSYHLFEAWIGRDAARLGDINGESLDMLQKALRICGKFRQPDGFSVVLNDGYALNMQGFLESASLESTPDGAFVLPESSIAFYHSQEVFAVLDSSPCLHKYSHRHSGKNGITLWFGGEPFIAESACCSYDDEDFWLWYKQPFAHSSLLINGKGDGTLQGRYQWLEPEKYHIGKWENHTISCRSRHWTRTLGIRENYVELSDEVTLDGISDLDFIFVLHPSVNAEIDNGEAVLTNGGRTVRLRMETSVPAEWDFSQGKFFHRGRTVPNRQLHVRVRAERFSMRIYFSGAQEARSIR